MNDSPGLVDGVPGELSQVFSNLMVNASDALQQTGGKLRIHVFDSHDMGLQDGGLHRDIKVGIENRAIDQRVRAAIRARTMVIQAAHSAHATHHQFSTEAPLRSIFSSRHAAFKNVNQNH